MIPSPRSVALLTDAFSRRDGEVVDGVANTLSRFAEHWARRFDRNEHRLTVITHGQGGDSVSEHNSVTVVRCRSLLPVAIHPRWHIDAVPCRRRVLRSLRRCRPDLIHVASPGSMGLTALIAARRGGLPLFGSYHTAYEENIRRRAEMRLRHLGLLTAAAGRFFNRLTWRYVIWFFNHMEKVVAPSRFTRSRISRLITPPTGIFSRGVDTETFNPRFRRTRPQVTALFVGRLVVDKNLEALVDIFANRDDVQLVVVGDGSERSWLEAALPDAEFTGHLTGEELSEAYASADLFVFPSETETFGNVVLEATASGLPVVTSDRMAPRELIDHGVNGYVARVGVDFGERVDTLIRDPGLRLTMGSAARRYALTRSWEAVFNGLIEDYRSLFSSARAAFEPAPASRSRAPLVRPCGEGPETALP